MKKIGRSNIPDWLTSLTGMLESVPAPWTSVKIKGDNFICWGREHDFNGAPFPCRIVSRGENMLARPIALRAVVEGREIIWSKTTVTEVERHPHGRYATRKAVALADGIMLTTVMQLFYDGAMRLDVRLDPLRPLKLDTLAP